MRATFFSTPPKKSCGEHRGMVVRRALLCNLEERRVLPIEDMRGVPNAGKGCVAYPRRRGCKKKIRPLVGGIANSRAATSVRKKICADGRRRRGWPHDLGDDARPHQRHGTRHEDFLQDVGTKSRNGAQHRDRCRHPDLHERADVEDRLCRRLAKRKVGLSDQSRLDTLCSLPRVRRPTTPTRRSTTL